MIHPIQTKLTEAEAEKARALYRAGYPVHSIAAMLKTRPPRRPHRHLREEVTQPKRAASARRVRRD